MRSIYHFTDYREYIRCFLEEKKRINPRYSMRCAASRCGVPSGTFTRIVNGTRNIGPSLLPRFLDLLGLRKTEAAYFTALVRFEHLTGEKEKRACYDELAAMRARRKQLVPREHYQFFDQWYNAALHELIRIMPSDGDPGKLGGVLDPAVSTSKARKALDLLETIGYIKKNGQGGYEPAEPFLTTGETWQGVPVHAFQIAMAALGVEALDRFPKQERDISTLSMALSDEAFVKVREILRETRERIAEVERTDLKPLSRVYQMNFQVFPLSKPQTEAPKP